MSDRMIKKGLKKGKSLITKPVSRIRHKFKRIHYDDYQVYVNQIKTYIEDNYEGCSVYGNDVEMIIRKLKLIDNPELHKIRTSIDAIIKNHNENLYVKSYKDKKQEEKKNTPISDLFFSWDNLFFQDGYVEIRDSQLGINATYVIKSSKYSFNKIKKHFKIKFDDLEIRIIDGQIVFNDEKRFITLLSEIKNDNLSSYVPDLKITPKPMKLRYFSNLSGFEIKKYIKLLNQKYLDYLCDRQIDEYNIYYTLEQRINWENSGVEEDAFIFTIAENRRIITVVYENVEEDRSSILFFLSPHGYKKGIQNISSYFSSYEINKRETLASNYVEFKDSGIINFRRIYHTDFKKWKQEIDKYR